MGIEKLSIHHPQGIQPRHGVGFRNTGRREFLEFREARIGILVRTDRLPT